MALEDDIKKLLVLGKSVTVTIRDNRGVDYTGEVVEIENGSFRLQGEITNAYEHYSNISADPVYRMYRFDIKDIETIRMSEP
jgi:hypothetical protein